MDGCADRDRDPRETYNYTTVRNFYTVCVARDGFLKKKRKFKSGQEMQKAEIR